MVTEVRGEPFVAPDFLAMRADDGQTWRFSVHEDVAFSTSHLRDHMNRQEPVTVFYRQAPEGLVAIRVTD